MYFLLLIFLQQVPDVEMSDLMHSEGKIYVVIVGILIVLTGILLYLYALGRKLRKLSERISTLSSPIEKKMPS